MTDLTTAGTKLKDISVNIRYRIINLFSGQLYQSPAKAIEELVANSYDAFATECQVIIPENLNVSNKIVVFDDGSSMDVDGFEDLWTIAGTKKRDHQSKKRLPIGRFGIGKLATYVLADKLTYVCKKDGQIRAVTMDFKVLDPEETKEEEIPLTVRILTEEEARKALALPELAKLGIKLPLFGEDNKHWTVVVLSDLKQKALELKLGRLRWLISYALPNIPDFRVYLNGPRVIPAKEEVPLTKSWQIGEDDAVATEKGLASIELDAKEAKDSGHKFELEIPGLGNVWGVSELYDDFITEGKSRLFGRSQGIFVMVRGRLINQDDAYFGIPPLSFETFNRFRLVIHADGLDDFIVASREGVLSNPAIDKLRDYIRSKFNEARNFYTANQRDEELEKRLSTKIGLLPSSLVGRPLRNLVEQTLSGERPSSLVRVPQSDEPADVKILEEKIEETRQVPKSLLQDVKPRSMGSDSPLAIFEAKDGVVYLNTDHPFFVNYSDKLRTSEPLDVMALAEVLTEAYLRDRGVAPEVAGEILALRDSLLREIVSVRPSSAVAIARRLREAGSDEKALEITAGDAFRALGFEVTPLGGSGKADGVAKAVLGRMGEGGTYLTYSLSYDAKSTSAKKVKAGNLSIAQVVDHRKKHKTDFAMVVAKDFQTKDGTDSLTARMAKKHKVTLIRSSDLANLVEAKAAKFLSLLTVKELFEKCRGPEQSKKWVDKVISTPTIIPPIVELLNVVHDLQDDGRDNVQLGDVKQFQGRLDKYSKTQLGLWFSGLNSLVPTLVVYNAATGNVEIHSHPSKILDAIASVVSEMPAGLAKEMIKALPQGQAKSTDLTSRT